MNDIPWVNVRMMLADAPKMVKKTKKDKIILMHGDELVAKMGLR